MFWETSQDNRFQIGYIAITRQDIDMYKAAIGGIQLAHNRPAIASPFESNVLGGDLNLSSGLTNTNNNNNNSSSINTNNNNNNNYNSNQNHNNNSIDGHSAAYQQQQSGQAHRLKENHGQMLGPIGSGAPPSSQSPLQQMHSHLHLHSTASQAAARMVMRSASLGGQSPLPASAVGEQATPTTIAPTSSTPAAIGSSQNHYQQQQSPQQQLQQLHNQPMGTIVEHVVPGSLMNIICKLKKGDEIVELNGVQLRNKSDVEVLQILESVKTSNTLRMVAIRQLDCSSPPPPALSPRSPNPQMAPTLSPSPIQHHHSHHRSQQQHNNHNQQQQHFHNQHISHHQHQHQQHQHHHSHQYQHQHRSVT